jgi:hypothetical protein
MFTAAYKDEFYLALRNALHAEVDSWHNHRSSGGDMDWVSLWDKVFALEETSKNSEATSFTQYEPSGRDQLVHLEAIQPAR